MDNIFKSSNIEHGTKDSEDEPAALEPICIKAEIIDSNWKIEPDNFECQVEDLHHSVDIKEEECDITQRTTSGPTEMIASAAKVNHPVASYKTNAARIDNELKSLNNLQRQEISSLVDHHITPKQIKKRRRNCEKCISPKVESDEYTSEDNEELINVEAATTVISNILTRGTEPKTNNTSLKKASRKTNESLTSFQSQLLAKLVSSQNTEEDADKIFLLSLLPDFKKLSDDEKLDFRICSLQFFKDVRKKNSQQPKGSYQYQNHFPPSEQYFSNYPTQQSYYLGVSHQLQHTTSMHPQHLPRVVMPVSSSISPISQEINSDDLVQPIYLNNLMLYETNDERSDHQPTSYANRESQDSYCINDKVENDIKNEVQEELNEGPVDEGSGTIENYATSKPTKKRKRNFEEWQRVQRKIMRATGKGYKTAKGKIVEPRILRSYDHNCRYKCNNKISEEQRKTIFKKFYKMGTYDLQSNFIASCIKKNSPIRKKQTAINNRNFTTTVTLMNLRVCKEFFLKTLDITSTRFTTVCKKMTHEGVVESDKRGKHSPANKISRPIRNDVIAHIKSFPSFESNYSGSQNENVRYLSHDLNIAKMYKLYVEWCTESNKKPVKKSFYRQIFFTEFNLIFHK